MAEVEPAFAATLSTPPRSRRQIHGTVARRLFANSEVFNRENDAERRTFDDIFQKRLFGSYIYKESNVYDRRIEDYKQGLSALLESERIREEITNFEHDMWEF